MRAGSIKNVLSKTPPNLFDTAERIERQPRLSQALSQLAEDKEMFSGESQREQRHRIRNFMSENLVFV